MTMVEKMARAICLAEHPNTMSPIAWKAYCDVAIAALETLRANSDDLLEAGIRAKDRHYDKMRAEGKDTSIVVIADHPAGTIFDAMIDAAISEHAATAIGNRRA